MVKFLIIRLSSIGDIVLTTPVIRGLKQQVEDAEIHFLTKPAFATVLKANPFIDKLHALDDVNQNTIDALKHEAFDYIIDLQNNMRSLNIKRSLKRMYFTVDKLNLKKWLLVNFRINKLPDKHIVDRYMDTCRLFDIQDDEIGLDYYIPDDEVLSMENLPEDYRSGFVALVIGAQHATKKLTKEKLADLVARINKAVILIGGPEDKEVGNFIEKANAEKKVLNACGLWSVNGSASVIKLSDVVITHDTGMMHVAAAFKKRIISVWGNTVPEFGMYPYKTASDSVIVQVDGLKCRPCSKIGHDKCPKKHFKCMEEQDLEHIARLID